MIFKETSEKDFQKYFIEGLVQKNQYVESVSNDFDKEFCINPTQMWEFIKTTQPKIYEMIQLKGKHDFLVCLDEELQKLGVIEVLRKGITFSDKTVDLFYNQPSSASNSEDLKKYESNIFSTTQELIYSTEVESPLDLVVFLNGIPVITCELKNPFSGEPVLAGIRQYQNERDPKEKLFSFARCMVHIAADTEYAFITTRLDKEKTNFFLFNKGEYKGEPTSIYSYEKGQERKYLKEVNEVHAWSGNNGGLDVFIRTEYLWKEILTKYSLSSIIYKFARVVEENDENTGKVKRAIVFPMYHQLSVLWEVSADIIKNGVGKKYLIYHPIDSGITKTIAWLAHHLQDLSDGAGKDYLFDLIIVVADQLALDTQLKEDIDQFAPQSGIAEHIIIDKHNESNIIKETIANGKRVITCTLQSFPHLLDEIADLPDMNYGIVIDQARIEKKSKIPAKINDLIESRRMKTNCSYVAFASTLTVNNLATYGITKNRYYLGEDGKLKFRFISSNKYKDKKGIFRPIFYPYHVYGIIQAREEQFILDVLKLHTAYSSFCKLIKLIEDNNDQFEILEVSKRLRDYVEGNEFAIAEKAEKIINHFHRNVKHLRDGEAKAIVITASTISAIKYKKAFDAYLKEISSPYQAIVTFSGQEMYKGFEYDEVSMNNFEENKANISENFKKSNYRFLIVAEKPQSRFNEPLLHALYIDKKLSDIQAELTLSKLNQSKETDNKNTVGSEFWIKMGDIAAAYEPHYQAIISKVEIIPNKHNDLVEFEVSSEYEMVDLFEKYIREEDEGQIGTNRIGAIWMFHLTVAQKTEYEQNLKNVLKAYRMLGKKVQYTPSGLRQLQFSLQHCAPWFFIEKMKDISQKDLESFNYKPSDVETEYVSLVVGPGEVRE